MIEWFKQPHRFLLASFFYGGKPCFYKAKHTQFTENCWGLPLNIRAKGKRDHRNQHLSPSNLHRPSTSKPVVCFQNASSQIFMILIFSSRNLASPTCSNKCHFCKNKSFWKTSLDVFGSFFSIPILLQILHKPHKMIENIKLNMVNFAVKRNPVVKHIL